MEINAITILIVIGGVVLGWILASIKSFFTVRKYKKELKEYQEHLNRQMKIVDDGNKSRENELATLKMENENLRISVKTLGQKPGRAELRLLNIYDAALRKMMHQAPGFSSAWEAALQEAEREYEESEKGFTSIIKKVFVPSIMQRAEHKEIEHSDAV
jgi:uncharacterized protein YydD (DUF2326 family)